MSLSVLGSDEIARLLTTDDPEALESLLIWRDEEGEGDEDCAFARLDPAAIGLDVLGTGASAVVLSHPDDDGLAIRVSEEEDGWVGYACDGPPNPHKPRVLSLGWTGLCWVAVCERLDSATFAEAEAFEREFWAPTRRDRAHLPPTAASTLLEEIEARGLCADDVCPRNILRRRDGDIVLNDPVAVLPWRLMESLKGRFDARAQPGSLGLG